ncbi:MAG: zinc-binding alcohol dehydrogenase [Pseudomonadota bacterium]
MAESTEALWYTGPGTAEIRPTPLPAMADGLVEIETVASLLSRGTERLVFEGRVPESEHVRMRAPLQDGAFPFPVKYGYAAAGRVTAGPESLLGRDVFTLAPHQRRLRVPETMALPLPEGVTARSAVLAANVETALNATWDAEIPPGAHVLVVGLGLVGLLVTAVLSRRADIRTTATDLLQERAVIAERFSVNFATASTPPPPGSVDLAFHTSASAAGLTLALNALRFEGTVIELSWYGAEPVPVPLGGAFHSQRFTIKSSQVGHVAPSRRATVTHRDRLARALALCADPRLEAVVSEEVDFSALPGQISRLLAPGAPGIATRIRY